MKIIEMALICALLALGSGCTMVRELPRSERPAELEKDEGFLIGKKLLTAFVADDAKAFVALLPEELQERFTVKHFTETRKSVVDSLGQPISFQYVTALELQAFTPHIWKIRFRRTDRSGKKTFTSEVLFRIITAKIDKKTVITAFQFL